MNITNKTVNNDAIIIITKIINSISSSIGLGWVSFGNWVVDDKGTGNSKKI